MMTEMDRKKTWRVQRRRLDDDEPYSWDTVACASASAGGREEAEHVYRRMSMYIQCHEMRLLTPDGEIALYYRDPSSFYQAARTYDEVLAERKKVPAVVRNPHTRVEMTT